MESFVIGLVVILGRQHCELLGLHNNLHIIVFILRYERTLLHTFLQVHSKCHSLLGLIEEILQRGGNRRRIAAKTKSIRTDTDG